MPSLVPSNLLALAKARAAEIELFAGRDQAIASRSAGNAIDRIMFLSARSG